MHADIVPSSKHVTRYLQFELGRPSVRYPPTFAVPVLVRISRLREPLGRGSDIERRAFGTPRRDPRPIWPRPSGGATPHAPLGPDLIMRAAEAGKGAVAAWAAAWDALLRAERRWRGGVRRAFDTKTAAPSPYPGDGDV